MKKSGPGKVCGAERTPITYVCYLPKGHDGECRYQRTQWETPPAGADDEYEYDDDD